MGIFGDILGAGLSLFGKNKDAEMQKDFAKKGIQWRVQDAIKAGIHPLAALGANTMSFTPVGVGDSFGDIGRSLGNAIDGPIARAGTSGQRTAQMEKLTLEHAGLENDLLRAQIQAITSPRVGPPMPSVDGPGGDLKIVPPQLTSRMSAGLPWKTNPKFVDAQSWEDRYGDAEILSMAVAALNGTADWYYNVAPTYRSIDNDLYAMARKIASMRGPRKYGPSPRGSKARYLKGY